MFNNSHTCIFVTQKGGLFDDATENSELIFRYAVEMINNQREEQNGKLEAITKSIKTGDEFEASKNLCELMSEEVVGILHGPMASNAALHVQNICDAKEMPLIETRSDPQTEQPVINLFPHPTMLAKLYYDLVEMHSWESFTILFEDPSW
jgi:glutamate receptor, ionotropic, invertebrate